ncbi:MAG: MATE family efflux transporter, partial [Candidatus Omnitrophica bacterium]|nr:MATE family efflux transporter [Candidatus Omnitrophota bacterium]
MPAKRKRRINNSITEGKLGASLWKLAMPMMAGALLQNLFTLTDLFFVGRLGYVAVGALTIAGVVISIIMMLSMGISAGTTALIAHFTGKKDYGSADKVLFQTVIISVVCSLATVLAGIFGRYFLLRLFGATEEVIPAASEYIRIVFTFSITIFLFIGFNQALRGSGDAVTPLKILLFANVLNIVLDPLFIFGIGFFPRLGVAGSAIATVISRGAGVFILFMHFIFGDSSLHFKRGVFRINIPLVARMVKIGFFTSFEVMLRQISILLLWRLIASFGTASIAATGIVMQIRMAVMMVGFGMGAAASVLIGQNMGASQPARAGKSG